jgi:hypothetical protein
MKRIFSILLCLLLLLSFAACGTAKEITDPAALAEALYSAEIYSTDLYPLDASLVDVMFELDKPYTAAYGYATAWDAADEIAVLVAADEAAAQDLLTNLEAHRVAFSQLYSTYAPNQCPRIDGALLMRVGNVVVWCVSDDTDAAKALVENHSKK